MVAKAAPHYYPVCIYEWICRKNKRFVYIGGTNNLKRRINEHKNEFKKGVKKKFYDIMRKKGWTMDDFFCKTVCTIKKCKSRKEMEKKELEIMKKRIEKKKYY